MPALEKNHIYRSTIEGYSSEGLGVARIDGQVVFVHDAVRGEDCDILVMKVLKNVAFGKPVLRHSTSPHRQEPDCPYYGRCGGCDFRHLDYAEELWAKRQRVQDALTRLGGSDVTVEEILGAAQPLRYRNKSQYPVSADGRVGFYRARSHQVVEVEHCLLQKPQADALAAALRQYLAQYHVPGYDETTGRGLVRHLYVRTNCKGESLVCLLVNGESLPYETELVALLRQAAPQTVGVVLGVNTRPGNAILGDRYRTLWGEDALTDVLCGRTVRLSVPSFYQVNHPQAEVLYGKALEFAGLTGTELAVDLYCGAGTITQVLARQARHVIGGEIVPEAIRDARASARRNGVENVEFLEGDAADVAAELTRRQLRPDVICVDPPRRGLAPEVPAVLSSMAPDRIVYVSCDPATLARDAKRLEELGYELEGEALDEVYEAFLNLADKKKEVYDEDLESLVNERDRNESALYALEGVQISCGFPLTPTATVTLRNLSDQVVTACEWGTGPVDAMCKAVNKIVQVDNDLTEFSVQSVTRGIDALGEVTIRVTDPSGEVYTGRGADGDIVVSSTKAYLNALNRLLNDKQGQRK